VLSMVRIFIIVTAGSCRSELDSHCDNKEVTGEEADYGRNDQVDSDRFGVRSSRFSVISRAAALAFDVTEHAGAECTTPQRPFYLFRTG